MGCIKTNPEHPPSPEDYVQIVDVWKGVFVCTCIMSDMHVLQCSILWWDVGRPGRLTAAAA